MRKQETQARAARRDVVSTLNKMSAARDPERGHQKADDLIMTYLRASGQADVADAYAGVTKRAGGWWYG